MISSLHTLSAGVASPVGFTLAANVAAFRSGLNAFSQPPYLRNKQCGESITVSSLDSLHETSAAGRVRYLAEKAAEEAWRPFAGHASLRVGVLLASGEDRPGLNLEAARSISKAIIEQIPMAVQKHCCCVQPAGSAGAMLLLKTAQDLVDRGEVDVCLLGGADSYVQIEALHWLEDCGRLKSSEQPNGVIPGEAAAFLTVASAEIADRLNVRSMADISGVAAAGEPRPWFRREATHGQGLTETLRETFRSSAANADVVFGEINGETWRADEWSYAYLRNAKRLKSPLRMLHPSSSVGEIGGASTAMMLALAAGHLNQANQSDETILVWAASGTSSLRGSCLLRKVEN